MTSRKAGLMDRPISETSIAIIDFETTGLNAGVDRVVEASVVRVDPGQKPDLILDTLVNPGRRMAATDIHGITENEGCQVYTIDKAFGFLSFLSFVWFL
jgi:DNA polymerase-3 subunit epsilon